VKVPQKKDKVKEVVAVEEKPEPKPVDVKIGGISRDGTLKMEFN
jgi:hypothetical protein